MLKPPNESGRVRLTFFLLSMSLFCFILSALRFYISENKIFLFLNWNLFLAFIPWAVSTGIMLNPEFRKNKIILAFLLFTWILFFPNSPYILTDLFHLKQRVSIPIWYDLAVILSFAWTGLIFGFISLYDIENLLSYYLKKRTVVIITVILLFVGSFGIYIGRYLRWNSWDILRDPSPLLFDISDRFFHPFSHPRTWGLTILFGILLNMMYWTLKFMTNSSKLMISKKL